VNISKDGFVLNGAQVPRLMSEFERKELARFTPCTFDNLENVRSIGDYALRAGANPSIPRGNGRLSRLLCQLMALQRGLPLLNFSSIKGKQREAYFAAVRACMGRDYAPMVEILGKWEGQQLALHSHSTKRDETCAKSLVSAFLVGCLLRLG